MKNVIMDYPRSLRHPKPRVSDIERERQEKCVKRGKAVAFIKVLRERESLLIEFDEQLWRATIEKIIVNSDKEVVFNFRDGNTVNVELSS